MSRLKAANWVSLVLNPALLAAALFAFLIFREGWPLQPGSLLTLAICLVFGPLAPTAYAIYLRISGKVDDLFIAEANDRLGPLWVGLCSCTVGTALLFRWGAPSHLTVLMGSYAILALILLAITTKWPVSLHAAGAWGPIGALAALGVHQWLLGIPVATVVVWARISLGTHTPAQAVVGALIGSAVTSVAIGIAISGAG